MYYCIYYVFMYHYFKPAIIINIHNNRKYISIDHIRWDKYMNAIGQFVVVIYQQTFRIVIKLLSALASQFFW